MTVDGSLLGCVTLGGWDGGCHRDTSGRSRIANGFTGGAVLQVGVQPKELAVTFWTDLLDGGDGSLIHDLLRRRD